jgi:Tfp pilus assembly protein PilN
VLRTNLSTRPFYNERPIHMAIGVAALLVVALTLWNIVGVVTLSRQNTVLATRVNADHAEAEQLTKMAAEIRRKIDKRELQLVVESAREANALIDQRTFSWTAFFNRLESTMPPDVMLTSVRPSVKDGATRVTMIVLGRRTEDIDEFIEKLEATGAFEEVMATQQDLTEEGLRRGVVESVYTGQEEPATAPEAPAVPEPAGTAPRRTGGAP